MKSRFLLYILASCSLLSCWNDSAEMEAIPSGDFIRTANSIEAEATDTEAALDIEANCRWTIVTQADWLTLGSGNGEGSGRVALTLTPNPFEHARDAALTLTSASGISRQVTVRQKAGGLPVVGELTLVDCSATQATVTCSGVTSMLPISEQGFCYGLNEHPTVADQKVLATVGDDGVLTATLTELTKGTTYHVRAFAVNGVGVSYSDALQFVALPMPGNGDNVRPEW